MRAITASEEINGGMEIEVQELSQKGVFSENVTERTEEIGAECVIFSNLLAIRFERIGWRKHKLQGAVMQQRRPRKRQTRATRHGFTSYGSKLDQYSTDSRGTIRSNTYREYSWETGDISKAYSYANDIGNGKPVRRPGCGKNVRQPRSKHFFFH